MADTSNPHRPHYSWRDLELYLYSARSYDNDLGNGYTRHDQIRCSWSCWSELQRRGLVIG